MKQTILRIISLILCLLLTGAMFAACGKDDEAEAVGDTQAMAGDVQGTAAAASSAEENLDEQTKYRPEQVDMGGYELRMYSCADQDRWFVYQDGLVGDPVNRALYNRQQFMEQYFNIKISIENIYPSKDLMSDLDKNFTNGQDFADILFIKSEEALRYAASKGQVMQLNNKEGFHLDASYWDQRIQTELSINGKLFLLEGDFSVYDELRTDGILYNRAMYKSLGHEDKYGDLSDVVLAGDWTFELLQTLIKDGSDDVNGDGLDKEDTIGFFTNVGAPYCYFLGSGQKIVSTVEGRMVSHLEESYAAVTETLNNTLTFFSTSPDVVVITNEFFGVAAGGYAEADKMMVAGKSYMKGCTLLDAMNLTDMKEDFGLLPIPKYTEEQDGYYCWLGDGNALVIPATAHAHTEQIVKLAEALCYFSRYMDGDNLSLYNAFFDQLSTTSLCRTAADYKIMELIFASKTYDLDRACALTGIYSLTTKLNPTTFSSDIAELKGAAGNNLNTYLESVMTNAVS